MAELVRMSISIEQDLFDRLERLLERSRAGNRSEFLRDLIRDRLVREEWEKGKEAVGTVTLIYNHHQRRLSEKLIEAQHHHHGTILAVTHVHLDEHLCAETILMKGRAVRIREIADLLGREKGVLHATLSMSSTGRDLA